MRIVLLQASMALGFVLLLVLAVYLLIGLPLIAGFFIRIYRKITGRQSNIKDGVPYYKDPVLFIAGIVTALIILLCVFYFLLIWFDRTFPLPGYFN